MANSAMNEQALRSIAKSLQLIASALSENLGPIKESIQQVEMYLGNADLDLRPSGNDVEGEEDEFVRL